MIEIRRILCPVDFSEFSERALHHALAMTRWYGARLTVLHVVVNPPTPGLPPIEFAESDRQQILADLERLVGQPASNVAVDFLVRESPDARREVLHQSTELEPDMLVMGSHGRSGFERLLLGSLTEHVIRKVSCPLMVVPKGAADAKAEEPVHFRRVLCPVDFSDASNAALEYALDISRAADAHLTLLHVIEVPPELRAHVPASGELNIDEIHAAKTAECLQQLRSLIPESVRKTNGIETAVRDGAAYDRILRLAAERKSDLIVMGVHGRGALELMVFGSNTARVVRAAACPVLVVRQS